jgi:hypothetical protein
VYTVATALNANITLAMPFKTTAVGTGKGNSFIRVF